ncbi:MAG TPA: hypothetical protein VFG12_03500 [Rhodopila sp.]|nr:hypothetical protein [Rhodopila sp.]
MMNDAALAVFADFNDKRDEPPPPVADPLPPSEALDEIRDLAWTDGYLAASQRDLPPQDRTTAAKLLTAVHELQAQVSETVDEAAISVAQLLVDTIIAITGETWPARLADRARAIADKIRPTITVAPEFVLLDADGTTRCFCDITDLSRALETSPTAEAVTVRWHRGEATISRTALLQDLRDAIMPLSAQPDAPATRNAP